MKLSLLELIIVLFVVCGSFYYTFYRVLIKAMKEREKWNDYKNFKHKEPQYTDLDKTLNTLGIPKESDL